MSDEEIELCRKYPFLPQCKKYVEGMDIKDLDNQKYENIMERAWERLEQALETGIISRRKIPPAITEDELRFHEANVRSLDEAEAMRSWNVLVQVFDGKVKVVKP